MPVKALQIDPTAHPGAMICLCLDAEAQQALRAAAGMPEAEADHVTLLYLAPDASALLSQKNTILRDLACLAMCNVPLDGAIGGIARFNATDSSDNEDVLVALYDAPDLPDLYADVVVCLEGCGLLLPTDHGFTPHITLGYLAPDAAQPVAQLPRLPLSFGAISLIWGGERIDLPLQSTYDADDAPLEAAVAVEEF